MTERRNPLSARPPQLDDADWLRRRYEQDGDMAIALDLRVDRKTVRRARERLGITSAAPGRRRGLPTSTVTSAPRPDPGFSSVTMRVVTRAIRDQRADLPPNWDQVLAHLAEADRAKRARSRTSEKTAAIAVAAAALRLAEHLELVDSNGRIRT